MDFKVVRFKILYLDFSYSEYLWNLLKVFRFDVEMLFLYLIYLIFFKYINTNLKYKTIMKKNRLELIHKKNLK